MKLKLKTDFGSGGLFYSLWFFNDYFQQSNKYQIPFLHWKRNAARQTTGPIQLVKGRVYFIEALMEDAGGPDHITVRVRLPSGTIQTPVSKEDFYTTPPGKNSLCLLVLIVHFLLLNFLIDSSKEKFVNLTSNLIF